jgi:hypothetical protein
MATPMEMMTDFAKKNPKLAGALTKPADVAADALNAGVEGAKKVGNAVLTTTDLTPAVEAAQSAVLGKKKKPAEVE